MGIVEDSVFFGALSVKQDKIDSVIACEGILMRIARLCLICALIVACGSLPQAAQAGWKAGLAKAVITPHESLWMAGYGGRTGPAEGTQHDLFIRVLALEDEQGRRGVILSSDTLGFPQSISDDVAVRLKEKYKLERSQVLLHASHTHCGPVLRGALYDAYPLDATQIQRIEKYSDWFTAEVVATIGRALEDLKLVIFSRG